MFKSRYFGLNLTLKIQVSHSSFTVNSSLKTLKTELAAMGLSNQTKGLSLHKDKFKTKNMVYKPGVLSAPCPQLFHNIYCPCHSSAAVV
jgi:hypothetical protein